MPCVVPFPDQALHPVGMGDSGLMLTEHLIISSTHVGAFSTEQKKSKSSISVQLKLNSVSESQFN